jgi:hypothetical protein
MQWEALPRKKEDFGLSGDPVIAYYETTIQALRSGGN